MEREFSNKKCVYQSDILLIYDMFIKRTVLHSSGQLKPKAPKWKFSNISVYTSNLNTLENWK